MCNSAHLCVVIPVAVTVTDSHMILCGTCMCISFNFFFYYEIYNWNVCLIKGFFKSI
uniref:Uncharacterized protein n=1 Tax=Anguilla anguilla TaxID=7936 RepID=A0A0E9SBR5_ANGAN